MIAAMATLLQTTIAIISLAPSHDPIHYSFRPYPQTDTHPFIIPSPLKITLWQAQAHYQLLLPFQRGPSTISPNPLPLPHSPNHNTTPQGQPITVYPSPEQTFSPKCPFTANLLPTMCSAFCANTCHQHCTNHYSAFRPIPFLRVHPSNSRCQLLTLEGVYPNTILAEISATIFSSPFSFTTQLTPSNHSDALKNHPLLKLMHSHHRPNCALIPILIPEPSPHVKLFLISTRTIPPYNSLRIRPPPEPPPTSSILRSNEGSRPSTDAPSLITSYFVRTIR